MSMGCLACVTSQLDAGIRLGHKGADGASFGERKGNSVGIRNCARNCKLGTGRRHATGGISSGKATTGEDQQVRRPAVTSFVPRPGPAAGAGNIFL